MCTLVSCVSLAPYSRPMDSQSTEHVQHVTCIRSEVRGCEIICSHAEWPGRKLIMGGYGLEGGMREGGEGV